MALFKKQGCKNWIFHCRVNGRFWTRSTGESDLKKAMAKVPELGKKAELHRQQLIGSMRLKNAITQEVDRLEDDLGKMQATRVSYGLENFFRWVGNILIEKIDKPMLERYQHCRLKEAARSTVDRELCYIIRLLKELGLKVDRPKSKRGKVTRQRAFKPEELPRFFGNCPEEYRTLFLVMLATGSRPAELIPSKRSYHKALFKNEVDLENRIVRIRSAKLLPGEEEKERLVQIDENLVGSLREQREATPGKHLFPNIQNLHRLFDRILKKAEIPKLDDLGKKLTAHSFRHTYATMMAQKVSGNQFVLKEILGHSQISTTDRYIHTSATAEVIDIARVLTYGKDVWKNEKACDQDQSQAQ